MCLVWCRLLGMSDHFVVDTLGKSVAVDSSRVASLGGYGGLKGEWSAWMILAHLIASFAPCTCYLLFIPPLLTRLT